MSVLRELLDLMDRRERWQLAGLGVCMLLMALLEMLGVASILPFMQVVSNPGLIQQNHWLSRLYEGLDFSSTQSFLLFLGLFVLVAIMINNGFSALTTWLMYRYAWSQNHRLSSRLLARYLDRPYSYYLTRNTAGLSKNILSEVQIVVQGVMLSVLKLACRVMVVVLMIGLLAAVNYRLALILGFVLGSAYGSVFVLLRRKQRRLGRERVLQNARRFQMASEALSGIKELKVLGRERGFLRRFREPSLRFTRTSASNQVVSSLPRYALETIAFGGILLIVLYSVRFSENVSEMLPVLSLYVIAGYRLLPSLNEMFGSAMQIRFNRPALEDLREDLLESEVETDGHPTATSKEQYELDPLPLRKALELRNVSFVYPEAPVASLESISMTVERNQVVGLVGETGAGKTTLVDVLLGLLEPTDGVIEVDGKPLTVQDRFAWRRSCGYIPQEIFLSDDSVRANIAFGVPPDFIDDESVRRAGKIAQIHEFVIALPDKYETRVGERGVRLSGGQRQRIGIARALYHDPDVLVMDEATSSLDGATEAAVMEMIHSLGRTKTLVVIAHRLSTVRECDVIYLLQQGRITASGTYEELARTNPYFRSMAGMTDTVAERV
jgi:ABC-type multidrug transport system fused ATPase/permease subunit